MDDYFSKTQLTRKRVVSTPNGLVAAQHRRAAEVGAAVLEEGGDAIDAAVATSFALGVVEPWMSGIAGGGCMVVWRAAEQKAYVVDYGMRSPRRLDPHDYPLAGVGRNPDLFAWPLVKDNRNVEGATAVAVPGVVAGMALAHEKFGRVPWKELVSPAVELAKDGMQVDWFSGLVMASALRSLAKDSDAAAMFAEDGQWPMIGTWTALTRKTLNQEKLASSLGTISLEGPRALYGGDVGRALARDVCDKGGSLSIEDLESYQAHLAEPLEVPYRGGRIFAAPGMTGGPALAHAMALLAASHPPNYLDFARALEAMWKKRFAESGDKEAAGSSSCTTHFSVVDRAGNQCAVTQTLLSIFGSRVVSPATGVLLNNGIMWFDPEPGKPNSLGPDKRCLANYCPMIGETRKGNRFALGASGGRKIIGTVLQIASFLIDRGMTLEDAFHAPRIDMSGSLPIIADQAIDPASIEQLRKYYCVETTKATCFPYAFAVPAAVMRERYTNLGCTEVMSPWGDVVAER